MEQKRNSDIIFIVILLIVLGSFGLFAIPKSQVFDSQIGQRDINLFSDLNEEFEKIFGIVGNAIAKTDPFAMTKKTEEDVCKEDWECSEWSGCVNNIQTRECYDLNECGTGENKPEVDRFCGEVEEIEKEIPQRPAVLTITLQPGEVAEVIADGNIIQTFHNTEDKEATVTFDPRPFSDVKILRYYGYIITLPGKPLALVYAENKLFPTLQHKINLRRKEIEAEQKALEGKLEEFGSNINVRRRFKNVLNGLAVSYLTPAEIAELRELEYGVLKNYQVHTTLMDSVPLINADDLWDLDKDGYKCTKGKKDIPGNKELAKITGRPIEEVEEGEGFGGECLTGKGVTIGIIDTGVDYTHEDLGGCSEQEFLDGECEKVVGGWDFYNNDNNPIDDMGHGTHCAATAAGNGVLKGVAPDAKIVAYKVLSSGGTGYAADIAAAIERSIDPNQDQDFSDHLDVISLSIGVICLNYNDDCGPDDSMSQAIDNAVNVGVIAVVAAGNEGSSEGTIRSPGTARQAITVAASDKNDVIASFSSRGPVLSDDFGIYKPDVSAPGVYICAAQWDNWYDSYHCLDEEHISISGTSMATPHVSGLVALLKQKNPHWESIHFKHVLRNIAIDIDNGINLAQGYGRIEALEAINLEKPPIAEINSGGKVSSVIDVYGTAYSDSFESYTIYIGEGFEPEDWTIIYESDAPVQNSILFLGFDTIQFPDGEYTIRLIVKDTSGYESEDRAVIIIDNIHLFLSKYQEVTNDQIFEINGNADTYNFGSYKLEARRASFYGRFIFEDSAILIKDSSESVENGLLGEWDLTTLDELGYYGIFLTVFDSADNIMGEDSEVVFIENLDPEHAWSLHPGWPIELSMECFPNGYGPTGSITPYDINNDGLLELFYSNGERLFKSYCDGHDPNLGFFGFDHEGNVLDGWYIENFGNPGDITYSTPAVGDVDGDGQNEVAIVSKGRLFLFDHQGNELFHSNPSIPVYRPYGNSPTLADLDNDGFLEIIFFESDYWYGNKASLRVLRYDGTNYFPPKTYSRLVFGQAVGDMNNDGTLDIVFVRTARYDHPEDSSTIEIVSGEDGERIDSIVIQGYGVFAPVLGDVDNDGNLDIAVSAGKTYPSQGKLYLFHNDGSSFSNWPKEIMMLGGAPLLNLPTLADLDGDGGLEIFIISPYVGNSGPIYVYHHTGENAWPDIRTGSRPYTQVLVADIDGDNEMEVVSVFGYDYINGVIAWNSDGSLVEGFPKQILDQICQNSRIVTSAPAIADIDNDGLLELIAHSMVLWNDPRYPMDCYYKEDGLAHIKIKVWDLLGTANPESVEWGMFQYDAQNTGCYNCG